MLAVPVETLVPAADDVLAQNVYSRKPRIYFAGARRDFVDRLPKNGSARILEVGCGSGETGVLALQAGKAKTYVGIELFPAAAAEARRVLTQVIEGDVERLTLPWTEPCFDVLILSEVLEHLNDPWRTVERLARVVRPGGMVLASSPNVAHWRIVRGLALGQFNLADSGPMDRTHLRWFTPNTFRQLFEAAGFSVNEVRPITPFAARTRLISRLTGGRADHLFMRQIAIRGLKRR